MRKRPDKVASNFKRIHLFATFLDFYNMLVVEKSTHRNGPIIMSNKRVEKLVRERHESARRRWLCPILQDIGLGMHMHLRLSLAEGMVGYDR